MYHTPGSGKTTLAKTLLTLHPTFTRLSIDEIIFTNHGLYGIDYPASPSLYDIYQAEADEIYLETFKRLLEARRDIILERSFYAKSDRDEFRGMIESAGERCILVYLRVVEGDKERLWERICERGRKEKDANSAFEISRERFERYWSGFEGPDGEGEMVVDVCLGA